MPRRVLTGTVISDKSDKTIVVRVERSVLHPIYGKRIRQHEKYHVHDEANAHKVGEVVDIIESRPISKLKKWTVVDRADEARL
jgi:small subunit ribosomal protein S17